MGSHRRVAADLPQAHESTLGILELAQPPRLRGWAAPALVKFAVVGTLACIATWLLADPVVRLPGLRSVV